MRRGESTLMAGGAYVLVSLWALAFHREGLLLTVEQATPLVALSLGASLLIRLSYYDLSIGSNMALSSAVASALALEVGNGAALALGLVAACLCGTLVGTVVAYARAPSLVVSFGMMWALYGAAAVVLGGELGLSVRIETTSPVEPMTAYLALLCVVLISAELLLRRTRIGWNLQVIAKNRSEAARTSIPVEIYSIGAFIFGACLSFVAGRCESLRIHSFSADLGRGMELDAIIAVLVGVVFSPAWRVTFYGSALGAVVLTSVFNRLDLQGLSFEGQYLIKGIFLVVVMSLRWHSLDRESASP